MAIIKKIPEYCKNPIYFVDGKEISKTEINHIPTNNIESVTVLKGENAIKKYGEKGKNGVIEIITKIRQ